MIESINAFTQIFGFSSPAGKTSGGEAGSTSLQTDKVTFSPRALELMSRRQVTGEEREAFAMIQAKSIESGGYKDPKAFLNTLSPQEMEVLRKVHTLADPIRIAPLDFEGAANLLNEPGAARDLNNDGFLGVGAGKGWVFPPPNAPANVVKAWEETTAGMSEGQKMLKMGSFMVQERQANLRINAEGKATGFYQPGERGYRNIYNEPGFSYKELVGKILTQLETTKGYLYADKYRESISFLTAFSDALERNGVT